MATTNHERVGKALELLKAGLAPFVEREFKNLYKGQALAEPVRERGRAPAGGLRALQGREGSPATS